jgi:bacteriocin biosynthesis cyclodehydratase domain-containing protein
MRPAIKSGLLPVWRDRDTLQIGVDPRRAIALSGMGEAASIIGLLDGSRDRDQVIAAAAGDGVPASVTERVLALLAAGGALDDFPASTLRALPPPLRARLEPELATTSLARRDGDGGARTIARRRAAVVWIEGDRPIGRAVARIMSASGIGQIRTLRAPANDLASSARQPAADGHARQQRRPAGLPFRPDLVVLVGNGTADRAAQLARDGIAHLAVMASEAIGIVGPLVVPGKTACLRCLDYVRAGNDPAWPLILAQIRSRRPAPAACDAVLTAAVAAQTAAQALCAIETAPLASAAANGTLELVLPDWRWQRRTWPPHPACPCATNPADNRQWRS